MSAAPRRAAVQAAACPEPPSAAGAPRRGRGLRIRVPLRLVVGAQYGDAALSAYVKVAALALRPEGCTARVATLAEYLGLPKRTVERGLQDLTRPDPVDGVVEVITTRRTKRGGTGDSAHRVVRAVGDGELFVWLPAAAATSLPPRLLRLYAVIAYAQARRIPLAYADMAGALRHQSGKAKGEPLGERQIARLVAELGATGWVTVREREGLQGRHAYEAHDHPLHAVPAAPDTDGGSGADTAGGSLASREDHGTDRPSKSAGGGSGIRRRRLQEVARGPVDNSAPSASATPSRGRGQGEKRSSSGGVAGPGASLSARSWEVLEPVRHLLDGARDWVVRRIDAEIRAQLAAGAGMERLTARLTRRYATTDPVRDGGRWILGAGLPRRGCGLDVCEDGVIWHTGQLCGCVGTASPTSAPAAAEERPAPGRTDEPSPPPEEPTPSVPLPRPRAPEPEPHLELSSDELERLRAAATADDIRRAIEEHGQALATYLYGHRRVVPVLIDLYGPLPQSS